MMGKIDEITRKISEIRAFTDESYLKTTHFVVFLLFGCSNEIRDTLERRAHEIIVDKKAIAFLSMDDATDAVAEVRSAVDAVSRSGVDQDLNELHFCPVIVSDMAERGSFSGAVDSLEVYKRNNDLVTIWKPFIIINTEEPSAEGWLREIAGRIKAHAETGASNFSRCCIMTRRDEKGKAVDDCRLLDTVLFVALLDANSAIRGSMGQRIAYRKDYPDNLFYTAQTVFISNPVIIRTLRCMHMLLDRIDADGGAEREPDLGFVRNVLEPYRAKLPMEQERITFVPLYGVMPDPDGDTAKFKERLRFFARKYYRSQFDENKPEIFARLRSGFLSAFIESGKSVEFLQGFIGNDSEIDRISRMSAVFQTSELPQLSRKCGMSPENAALYMKHADGLREELSSIGSKLLKDFFHSKEFTSLPRLISEARKRIKDLSAFLSDEVKMRENRGDEIYLELIDDPDERIVAEAAKELSAQLVISKRISDISLALESGDEGGINEALSELLDSLFYSVRGLSGGSGARKYMDLLSKTCESHNSDLAKKCVTEIGRKSKFPVRFNRAGQKNCTFVWGSRENDFYAAWERQQTLLDTTNEFLPINSNERVVLLTVSPPFRREDIRGIARDSEPAPDHTQPIHNEPAPDDEPAPDYEPASDYAQPVYTEPAPDYEPMPDYEPTSDDTQRAYVEPQPDRTPPPDYEPASDYAQPVYTEPAPDYEPMPYAEPIQNHTQPAYDEPAPDNASKPDYEPTPDNTSTPDEELYDMWDG